MGDGIVHGTPSDRWVVRWVVVGRWIIRERGGGAGNAAPPANPFESGELDDDAMDDGYGDGGGSLFDFFSEDE